MNFKEDNNRIYYEDENGVLLAEVTFPDVKETVVEIDHTFVSETLRGQGVAGMLLEAAVKKISADRKKIIPTCSYAIKWFEKNDQYVGLLYKE